MKLLPILNKPAIKANNKQAGIVFLEYVIIAFIITVAVICAMWWFYWHLQRMTWETKQKLGHLTTNLIGPSGELNKPGEFQPTTGPFSFQEFTFPVSGYMQEYISENIPFPNQQFIIHNPAENAHPLSMGFLYLYDNTGLVDYITIPTISPDNSETITYNHSNSGPPYKARIFEVGYPNETFTVTLNQLP